MQPTTDARSRRSRLVCFRAGPLFAVAGAVLAGSVMTASPVQAEEALSLPLSTASVACVERAEVTAPEEFGGLGLTPVVLEVTVPLQPDAPAPEPDAEPPPLPDNVGVAVVTLVNPTEVALEATVTRHDDQTESDAPRPFDELTVAPGETRTAAYEIVDDGTSVFTITTGGDPAVDDVTVLAEAVTTHDCVPTPELCAQLAVALPVAGPVVGGADDTVVPLAEGMEPCPGTSDDDTAVPGTEPAVPGTGESDDAVPGTVPAGTGESDAVPGAVPAGTGESDAVSGAVPAGTGESDAVPGTVQVRTGESDAVPGAVPAGTGESDAVPSVLALEVSQPGLPPPPPGVGGVAGPSVQPPTGSESEPAPDPSALPAAMALTGSNTKLLVRLATFLLIPGVLLMGAARLLSRPSTSVPRSRARGPSGWRLPPDWAALARLVLAWPEPAVLIARPPPGPLPPHLRRLISSQE
jgi:hypothetical protein